MAGKRVTGKQLKTGQYKKSQKECKKSNKGKDNLVTEKWTDRDRDANKSKL